MTPDGPSQKLCEAALAWHKAGCSIIPIRCDGTKRPVIEWKHNTVERAEEAAVIFWFTSGRYGIGVVCGQISGNLELLELEGRATTGEHLDKIHAACVTRGVDWLWDLLTDSGYAEWTPTGGLHFLYRISDHPVPGNTKVAGNVDRLCLAETRGEGGYVIVAPSGGDVHPTGDTWSTAAGSVIGAIPTLTWADRCLLHEAVKEALDETPSPPAFQPAMRSVRPSDQNRPGDDFNLRATWDDILLPHGWQVHSRTGRETLWTRPDKAIRDGHSASTGYAFDADRLYVWSTSTVFPSEVPISKFHAYTLLEHGGDFRSAARRLGQLGYGDRAREFVGEGVADLIAAIETGDGRSGLVSRLVPVSQPSGDGSAGLSASVSIAKPKCRKRYNFGDVGNAMRLIDLMGDRMRYVGDAKRWAVYRNGKWSIDREENTRSLVHEFLEQMFEAEAHFYDDVRNGSKPSEREQFERYCLKQQMTSRIDAMLREARCLAICVDMADFDADPMLLGCPNGVVDLSSGRLLPHDPQYLITQFTGVDYVPDADCPQFVKFLERVMPSEDTRDWLHRWWGYSCTGSINAQIMTIHEGTGANGKSQLVTAFEKVFGEYGQNVPRNTLLTRHSDSVPNDIARMRGKRWLSCSEPKRGFALDEELVKSLTGDERTSARFLYGEFFEFKPTGKVDYVTNHYPRISNAPSIWRRLRLVRWEVTIGEDERILGLGDIMGAEEGEGILAWLVRGALRWQREGLEATSKMSSDLMSYREDEDDFGTFIADELVEVSTEHLEPTANLYKLYQFWCERNGMRADTSIVFGKKMAELGFRRGRMAGFRGFYGIRPQLKSAASTPDWG